MIKATVDVNDRRRRVKFADRFKDFGRISTDSCEHCGYAEQTRLVEHYYTHDVLMCQYPGTEGLIVHDYGHYKDNNGGIHPSCRMCCDMPDPAPRRETCPEPCPEPRPNSCKATRIKDSHAHIHEDGNECFHYVMCPYCDSMNRLDDSTIGYRYCGWCDKLFNVK